MPSASRTRPKSTCRNVGSVFRAGPSEALGHRRVGGGHRVGVVEDLVDELEAVAASDDINDCGKKQGVSLIGKPSVAPVRVSSRRTRSRYFASVHDSLNAARRCGIKN